MQSTFTHQLPAHGYTILITALWGYRQQCCHWSSFILHSIIAIRLQKLHLITSARYYSMTINTYEELPLPSRWLWSPKTRYRSVRYTNNRVIFNHWNPVCVNTNWSYPVVIGGIRILVTGDNLRSHPIWGADESVSTSNSPVQLSTHSKINWRYEKTKAWDGMNRFSHLKRKGCRCLMYQVWLLRSPSTAHSALWYLCEWLYGHGGEKGPAGRQSTQQLVKSDCCCSFLWTMATVSYPQNFSTDVRNPVLFKRAALGVFHKVGHWSCATKLHHQLNKMTNATGESADRMSLTTVRHQTG